MNTNPNGDLDQQDREILAALIPEGPEPGTPPIHGVGKDTETTEDAPLVASTPAAPAPAATTAPAASPAPTAAPVAATPAASPAPTAAPAQPEHNAGNLRSALRASRHNERQALERAAAAEAEAKRLREQAEANGTGTGDGGDEDPLTMSEARIAEIAKDFPLQAKTIQRLRELDARTKQTQAPAPGEWKAPTFDPKVQAVIDEVPKLLEWQLNQADQPKFAMASEFDDSLRANPLWKNKPAAERFAEAVRLTEAALGASPAPAPTSADSAAAAAALAAAAPSTGKPGLSDFRGGGTAQAPELDFRKMTDEQILGSLVPDA